MHPRVGITSSSRGSFKENVVLLVGMGGKPEAGVFFHNSNSFCHHSPSVLVIISRNTIGNNTVSPVACIVNNCHSLHVVLIYKDLLIVILKVWVIFSNIGSIDKVLWSKRWSFLNIL